MHSRTSTLLRTHRPIQARPLGPVGIRLQARRGRDREMSRVRANARMRKQSKDTTECSSRSVSQAHHNIVPTQFTNRKIVTVRLPLLEVVGGLNAKPDFS